MKDLELERKVEVQSSVINLIGGIIFTIIGLVDLIPTSHVFQSSIPSPPWLLIAFLYFYVGCVEMIEYQHAKSHYLKYPSNDLCDLCGENVEKIKIRRYGGGLRLILCKKCHKKQYIFDAIGLEIVLFILILSFFLLYPRSTDISIIIVLSLYICSAVTIPPVIIFQIRRY